VKFNWGFKIAAFYIGFVAFMIAIAAYSFTQDVNLVSDDYYKDEINYQSQIEMEKRTNALDEQLKITSNTNFIKFSFPQLFMGKEISGEIHFYRPSDSNIDILTDVEPNDSLVQFYSTEEFEKGLWRVKVTWTVDSLDYFNQKIIMMN